MHIPLPVMRLCSGSVSPGKGLHLSPSPHFSVYMPQGSFSPSAQVKQHPQIPGSLTTSMQPIVSGHVDWSHGAHLKYVRSILAFIASLLIEASMHEAARANNRPTSNQGRVLRDMITLSQMCQFGQKNTVVTLMAEAAVVYPDPLLH